MISQHKRINEYGVSYLHSKKEGISLVTWKYRSGARKIPKEDFGM
jgi:hypothetical protein